MTDYEKYLESIGEYGIVQEVRHPIAVVSGLPKIKPHEVVIFESGQVGESFAIDKETVDILVYDTEAVKVGTKIVRTDKYLSIAVGDELLGCIVDPIGNSISSQKTFVRPKEEREIDQEVHKLADRLRIKEPLYTGMTVVDMMIPLGKGQRELVIGDRKTGKSSFLLSTMKQQALTGTVTIYAGIGRKKSDVKILYDYFVKEGIMDNVIMVITTAHDSPSSIYLTPYTAMTIAEYFRDQGRDVLVVFDDLSAHAKFYREISLLAKRFPGRESYPGDIFFVHSKLVERAGHYRIAGGKSASITAIPVIEIVESDLAGYISTNVMGMTDGHIFFDTNAFSEGKRPAINIPLSVTRVGKQTQTPLRREITSKVAAFLSTYTKLESYSHFGAELSEDVRTQLARGANIYTFFNQHYNETLPMTVQVTFFALIWADLLNDRTKDEIHALRTLMIAAYKTPEGKAFFEELENLPKFNELIERVKADKDKILDLCKTKNP